jgi:tRNA uridine 5-carboxymethylaminomethyl modification enzyme
MGTVPGREDSPAIRYSPRDFGHVPALALVELEVKYEGYIARMKRQLAEFDELESITIPARIDFARVPGLSNEVREKLSRSRPASVGQAQRIPGVTPAAVFALLVHLKGRR